MEKEIKERWRLTYPEDKIKEPIIYQIGKLFKIVTCIFSSGITPVPSSDGYIAKAEIDVLGTKKELDKVKEYLAKEKIQVEFEEI